MAAILFSVAFRWTAIQVLFGLLTLQQISTIRLWMSLQGISIFVARLFVVDRLYSWRFCGYSFLFSDGGIRLGSHKDLGRRNDGAWRQKCFGQSIAEGFCLEKSCNVCVQSLFDHVIRNKSNIIWSKRYNGLSGFCLSVVVRRMENVIQFLLKELWQPLCYHILDGCFCIFAKVTLLRQAIRSMAVVNSWLEQVIYIIALRLPYGTFQVRFFIQNVFPGRFGIFAMRLLHCPVEQCFVDRLQCSFGDLQERNHVAALWSSCGQVCMFSWTGCME